MQLRYKDDTSSIEVSEMAKREYIVTLTDDEREYLERKMIKAKEARVRI